MILQNAVVYGEDFCPRKADIEVEGMRICRIAESLTGRDTVDLSGCTVMPGFVDIHIHGCGGGGMADASVASLQTMSRFLAANGVTSFCPTSMTQPEDALSAQFAAVEETKGTETGAHILGVRMEGPYLSADRRGAQNIAYIRPADAAEFARLNEVSPVRIVDAAPETAGATAFAHTVSRQCTVSIAHTAADFETAQTALQSGFSHATHLFNAMPPIQHRAPGAVTAVLDNETATAEMICDGFHIHPAIVRMAFRLLGEDRAMVVSDAMHAAGCADGTYALGGQTVYVRDGKARLADGTIAASTTNIYAEFRNLLRWGIPMRQALKACTINPSRVARADAEVGSIACGKLADILVLDETLSVRGVLIRGKWFQK